MLMPTYNEDSNCPTAVLMAITNNETSILENHLSYGADPNANIEACEGNEFYDGFPKGSRLLHFAAYYKSITLGSLLTEDTSYDLLIAAGADQNIINEAGYTPSDISSCVSWLGRYSYFCRDSMEINSPLPPRIYKGWGTVH